MIRFSRASEHDVRTFGVSSFLLRIDGTRNPLAHDMAALPTSSTPGQTPAPGQPLAAAGGQTLRFTPACSPAPGAPVAPRLHTAAGLSSPALTASNGQAATGHSHHTTHCYLSEARRAQSGRSMRKFALFYDHTWSGPCPCTLRTVWRQSARP